jgi:PHD/YefM family antitoxin component YafN of YafNO toxin-antitoxin module
MATELSEERPRISLTELRSQARSAAADVLEPGDPIAAVSRLRRAGMVAADDWRLGEALQHVWGGIADERRMARGSGDWARLARECAVDFLEAVGDETLERAYCDRWVDHRLAASSDLAPAEDLGLDRHIRGRPDEPPFQWP